MFTVQELCDVVEPDSDEEDEEPVRIHSNPTGPGGADDDILPISGLLLGRLQSSIQVSESGRYGEEEHIYQGVGLPDEERRDAELAQSSADYTEVDTDGRSRSDTVFEVMEPTDSVHRYSPRGILPVGGAYFYPFKNTGYMLCNAYCMCTCVYMCVFVCLCVCVVCVCVSMLPPTCRCGQSTHYI